MPCPAAWGRAAKPAEPLPARRRGREQREVSIRLHFASLFAYPFAYPSSWLPTRPLLAVGGAIPSDSVQLFAEAAT